MGQTWPRPLFVYLATTLVCAVAYDSASREVGCEPTMSWMRDCITSNNARQVCCATMPCASGSEAQDNAAHNLHSRVCPIADSPPISVHVVSEAQEESGQAPTAAQQTAANSYATRMEKRIQQTDEAIAQLERAKNFEETLQSEIKTKAVPSLKSLSLPGVGQLPADNPTILSMPSVSVQFITCARDSRKLGTRCSSIGMWEAVKSAVID